MQTLPQQTLIFGADEWTSLQVGSPARMLVKQSKQGEGDNLGLKEKEPDYGGTCAGRLMKSARAGLLQKTLPISQELTTEEILQKILHSLSGLGYNAEWKIMYASDAGAPQRRARCYLVAYSDGVRLPEGESFFSDVCQEVVKERRMFSGTSLSVGISWVSQPPVCSVGYGFSDKSSGVYGKSKLKEEVFHAYGNSMCPQIVHGIFKRIEELDN